MEERDKKGIPIEVEENDEQRDEESQAQTVADDARLRSTDLAEDSERGGSSNPARIIPEDTPDLVERMEEMNRSGHIDFDAFTGEPQMDDEESALGQVDTENMDDEDGMTGDEAEKSG